MKGVVLAGGSGSRLYPLTKITNKHLLPLYKKPMIYYPINTLVAAGIKEIMVVCGGQHAGEFLRLLGRGTEFGLRHLNYAYQETEGGIAEALSLAEYFVGDDRVIVILGDNLFGGKIEKFVRHFKEQPAGARILLKEVEKPSDYGVPRFDGEKIIDIMEKPQDPPTKFAVTGLYMYDSRVFSYIKELKPSARGELEITDINNRYIKENKLEYDVLDSWWIDAGASLEAYYRAIAWIAHLEEGKPLFG